MRLMIISNLYPPRGLGGYEIAAQDVADGLAALGHEVRVLTSPMEDDRPADDAHVHRILGLKTFGPVPDTTLSVSRFLHYEAAVSQVDNSLILLGELREFAPDHVMAFNLVGLGGIGLIDVLRRTGTSWSLNLGDTVPLGLTQGLDRRILDAFGVDPATWFTDVPFVSVSSLLVDEIEAGGVRLGPDRLLLPRGIDAPPLPAGDTAEAPRRADGVTRFVFTGSLHENKGVDLMLQAVAAVQERFPDIAVDVFGRGEDEKYRALAAELGVDGAVTFHGYVDRATILTALSRAEAFLFPTWEREPLGQAPLQAAAMGCVPIITAQAGVAEWLSDGAHCLKIDRTSSALATAMTAILTGEVDARALGARASRHVRAALSHENYLGTLTRFIDQAVAARRSTDQTPASRDAIEIIARDARAQAVLHTVLRENEGYQ